MIKASKFGPFPESLVAVYIQQVLQVGAAGGRGRWTRRHAAWSKFVLLRGVTG